jgi:hypothetical protein
MPQTSRVKVLEPILLENPDSIFFNLTPEESLHKIDEIQNKILPSVSALGSFLRDSNISPRRRIAAFFGYAGVHSYKPDGKEILERLFKKHGYNAEFIIKCIRDVIITKPFTKFVPNRRWPSHGKTKDYFCKIYELAVNNETETVLGVPHHKITRSTLPVKNVYIRDLYDGGYIGHDGDYTSSFSIKRNSIKNVFILNKNQL